MSGYYLAGGVPGQPENCLDFPGAGAVECKAGGAHRETIKVAARVVFSESKQRGIVQLMISTSSRTSVARVSGATCRNKWVELGSH